MRTAIRAVAMTLLALAFSLGASAQLTKGLRGKVLDRDGKPVAGVTVTIEDTSNKSNRYETKTDEKGNYVYAGLPYSSGGYDVTVQVGTLPAVTKHSEVKMLEPKQLDFDMREDLQQVQQEEKASAAAEAKALYEAGDYEGAIAKAEEAIVDEENVKAASFFKAAALVKLDRTDDSIAAWESYNSSYPGEMSVLGQLAILYEKKGDKAKADEYRKAFKAKGGLIPGDTYNQAVAAVNAGEKAKAAELFREAIEEDPKDPDPHRELGKLLAGFGKYAEAAEELKVYLKMKPDAPDAEMWRNAIPQLESLAKPAGKK